MQRRTKVIATLGPASNSPHVIRSMIERGADVFRLGLAHGSLAESIENLRLIRKVSAEFDKFVGVLIDLPGPKVRIAELPSGGVDLPQDTILTLIPEGETSTATSFGVDYPSLLTDVNAGDVLAIGDGVIRLQVESVDKGSLAARVTHGGSAQGRPGLHIPSDRLTLSTPTADDLYKLDAFVEEGVDMVAISFVRSAHDVRRIGTEPHPRGPLIVAKIETRAAVNNLQGIIEASGAIMIARGDLGIELGIEELPHVQKQITRDGIALGKPVITATQMLESMITAATPTRAEASDIANAVFDGTSAVMLSGETAIGQDPANAVEAMARIAGRADAEFDYDAWARRIRLLRSSAVGSGQALITDAMTAASWRAATDVKASAILAISGSGFTVRSIARFRPEMPIIGFTENSSTAHQLSLSWGTTPMLTSKPKKEFDLMNDVVIEARDRGFVRSGECVAVVAGVGEQARATDTLRLMRVP